MGGNNIFAGLPPALLHGVVNQCMSMLDNALANYLPELEEEVGGTVRIVVQNSLDKLTSEVIVVVYKEEAPTVPHILYHDTLAKGVTDMLGFMKSQWEDFGMLEGIASSVGISTEKMASYSESLTKYIDILSTQYAEGKPVRIILLSHENAQTHERNALVNLQMQEEGLQWIGMLVEGKKANYWLAQLAEKVRELIDKNKKA